MPLSKKYDNNLLENVLEKLDRIYLEEMKNTLNCLK